MKTTLTKKIKKYDIIRVVTSFEAVPFHLKNTLELTDSDFSVAVVGDNVSQFNGIYEGVDFFDIKIERNISIWRDIVSCWKLFLFLLKYRPKIVHSIMPKAGLVTALSGFFARTPVRVHTFTGQVWATKTGAKKVFLKLIDKLILSLNTTCLTDSFSQSDFLKSEGLSVDGKAIPVLGMGSLSGVKCEKFAPELFQAFKYDFYAQYKINKNEFVFLFLARKSVDKGVFDLMNAFMSIDQSLYPSRLIMIGPVEDETYSHVLNQINDKGLIIDLPKVDNHERYLSLADALCLFSYREGFGSIAIDAAAAKVPVLGTKIPGLVDAVRDGETGFLVEAGNLTEIKDKLIYLIQNRDLARKIGLAGYDRVVRYFSARQHYDFLKQFYKEQLRE